MGKSPGSNFSYTIGNASSRKLDTLPAQSATVGFKEFLRIGKRLKTDVSMTDKLNKLDIKGINIFNKVKSLYPHYIKTETLKGAGSINRIRKNALSKTFNIISIENNQKISDVTKMYKKYLKKVNLLNSDYYWPH